MGVDFYNGGDHATAHLVLRAPGITRFFTKIGLLNEPEPFKQMLYNGKIVAQDGSYFSKLKATDLIHSRLSSKGTVLMPRTYLMFAALLELGACWDEQGARYAPLLLAYLEHHPTEFLEGKEVELDKSRQADPGHRTQGCTESYRRYRRESFNTAIAASMEGSTSFYLAKPNYHLVSLTYGSRL